MYRYDLEFYLASDLSNKRNSSQLDYQVDEIDIFSQLYAENLIIHLNNHYEVYSKKDSLKKKGNEWNVSNIGLFNNVNGIEALTSKKKLTGISGSIGESLIIPSLNRLLGNEKFSYHRLTSKKKCPDFRIEIIKGFVDLWKLSLYKPMISDIPLEVKSRFGNDSGYPKGALQQLVSYWRIMSDAGIDSSIGKGIIVRANLLENKGVIKFILFYPKNRDCLEQIKSYFSLDTDEEISIELFKREGEFFA